MNFTLRNATVIVLYWTEFNLKASVRFPRSLLKSLTTSQVCYCTSALEVAWKGIPISYGIMTVLVYNFPFPRDQLAKDTSDLLDPKSDPSDLCLDILHAQIFIMTFTWRSLVDGRGSTQKTYIFCSACWQPTNAAIGDYGCEQQPWVGWSLLLLQCSSSSGL